VSSWTWLLVVVVVEGEAPSGESGDDVDLARTGREQRQSFPRSHHSSTMVFGLIDYSWYAALLGMEDLCLFPES
jgi:hypothetical protein